MKKVLYLDDNRVALKLMERTMKNFVHVYCATSQSRAFEILETQDIALVMIDYTLEDGNGIEFARKLRRDERFQKTPIILLSASLTSELSYFAMRCGINQSRRKPLSPAEVQELISHQLSAPFVEPVERPYFVLGCIAWEHGDIYYQYSPDLNRIVQAESPEEAHKKMNELLRDSDRGKQRAMEEIVGIEIVYHRLDDEV